MSSAPLSASEFIAIALRNPVNVQLLSRLQGLAIPQCYLTAGCLFQSVWNLRSSKPVDWGINDYDVFYFDDSDLTEQAEDRVIHHVLQATADLEVNVEVKNQARVHHWYEKRFHAPCPTLRSAREGIDRYLVNCTRVGIDVISGELYAPDGLDDLAAGILRPNPVHAGTRQFDTKARSYQQRWPWLQIG